MEKKHRKTSRAQKASETAAGSFVSKQTLKSDPSGSYTGRPREKGEKPEQDADDL